MNTIIEFPSGGDTDSSGPVYAKFSATPEQMLQYCVEKLVGLEASLETMRIAIITDLSLLSHSEALDDLDQANENYRQTRRSVVEHLCRDLEKRFPVSSL